MRIDRLYNVKLDTINRTIMAWVNQGQHERPEDLIVSGAITFLALCERFGMEPRTVLEVAERVLRNATEHQPNESRALRMYLQHELR